MQLRIDAVKIFFMLSLDPRVVGMVNMRTLCVPRVGIAALRIRASGGLAGLPLEEGL